MVRVKYDEIDNYGGTGGAGYFSLKNDKDVAQVRFMYNNVEDLQAYAVHEVEVGDRKRYVNCLRGYDSPIDDCPFCREHMFQRVKFFIPLYNLDADKVQIWDRGKKMGKEMVSLMSRYSNEDIPFVSQVFEIERQGKAGDQTTTYGIYPVGNADDTVLEDLPEPNDILGNIILDKTAEDMECYLETGKFPPETGAAQDVMPRGSRRVEEQPVARRQPATRDTGRRTPANSNNRRSNRF